MNNDIEKAKIGLKLADEIIDVMKDKDLKKSLSDYEYIHRMDYELFDKMSDGDYIKNSVDKLNSENESVNKLLLKIDKNTRKRKNLKFFKITTLVAAMITAVSFILLSDRDTDKPEIAFTYDNESTPTLILSNGERVILNNHNNIKDNTSVAIEKIADNTIIYNTKKDSVVKSVTEMNTMVIPYGFTYGVHLSDGTTVTLNAGSKLTYPVTFDDSTRNVILDGEAYFKVTKSSKPFIVTTNGMSVKVYGTEFNINHMKMGITEVVLVSGSIGVKNKNSNEVILKPNELYTASGNEEHYEVKTVNPENYIGWLSNNFNYERVSLEVFINKISSWYGIDFAFDKESLKEKYIDINARRDTPILELIRVLEKITDIIFIKESQTKYTIKHALE